MKLRALLLIIITTFFTLTANAQVFVSKRFVWKVKEFDKGEYDLIKSKKTIFVLDDLDLEALNAMLKDTWTYNEFEVIDSKTYWAAPEKYITENNVIFKFYGYVSNSQTITANDPTGMNHTTSYPHIYLHYFYPTKVKIKKDGIIDFKVNEVAAIFLNANISELGHILDVNNVNFANVTNYKLGYLKNCFQNISNILKNKGTAFAYDNTVDAAKIKNLAKSVLYVPEYIKTSNTGFVSEEKAGDEAGDLFKDYPYKYEFISDEELNNKILAGGKETFYYLTFVRLSGQKIIVVTDGLTGDIIYNEYVAMTFYLKAKDIARIADKISKGK